jgi:hypothetical protein
MFRIARICAHGHRGMVFDEFRRGAVNLIHGFTNDFDVAQNGV